MRLPFSVLAEQFSSFISVFSKLLLLPLSTFPLIEIADNLKGFKEDCLFIIDLLEHNTFNYLQSIDKWFAKLKKDHPGSKVQELGFLTIKYLDLIELFLRDLLWLKLDRKIVNNLYQDKLRDLSNKFEKENLLKNLLNIYSLKNKLKYNVSPQLLWENLLLSIK